MGLSDRLICFLGPKGTSDQRTIALFRSVEDYEALPMASISEIIETVNYTPGCLGVVPIENSTEGELMSITDKLIFESDAVKVQEEAVLAEQINAFGLAEPSMATTVVSHPQILELGSRFIRERGLAVKHVASTTEACRYVRESGDGSLMALAPPSVGHGAGLSLYRETVLDVPEIRTRYVLLGQGHPPRTGRDRTMVAITPSVDVVGSLSQIAAIFANFGVNMTSIISRPLQAKLGVHSFLISCEGHIADVAVRSVIINLLRHGHSVKHLGSFPKWAGVEVTTPFAALPLGSLDPGIAGDEEAVMRALGLDRG
ncbi:MAG: prephenate dehydratase [Acidimicrobiales bacterium]